MLKGMKIRVAAFSTGVLLLAGMGVGISVTPALADGGNTPLCEAVNHSLCSYQGNPHLLTRTTGSPTNIRAVASGAPGWYYLKEGGLNTCLMVQADHTLELSTCAGKYSQEFAWQIDNGNDNEYSFLERNLSTSYLLAETGDGGAMQMTYSNGVQLFDDEVFYWPVQV